jgi:hypothetical protein
MSNSIKRNATSKSTKRQAIINTAATAGDAHAQQRIDLSEHLRHLLHLSPPGPARDKLAALKIDFDSIPLLADLQAAERDFYASTTSLNGWSLSLERPSRAMIEEMSSTGVPSRCLVASVMPDGGVVASIDWNIAVGSGVEVLIAEGTGKEEAIGALLAIVADLQRNFGRLVG